MISKTKLSKEEKELLDAVEAGEYESVLTEVRNADGPLNRSVLSQHILFEPGRISPGTLPGSMLGGLHRRALARVDVPLKHPRAHGA